jgi:FkbM family methyltransferase
MSVNNLTNDVFKTTVIDVGARYGKHPSWDGFKGGLQYIAFEPDNEEAERLRKSNIQDFEVVEAAVYDKEGEFDFNLLVHRGMSSFLKPDLNSEAFKDLKPGLGNIEKIIKIKTERLDSLVNKNKWSADFLKVDTEGTEHEVIISGDATIKSGVLGIRSSVNFNHAFHNQVLFSTTHDYLVQQGFMLLNIDYCGLGYPKLGLFKKPDPTMVDSERYGVMVGCDAVWIKKPASLADGINQSKDRDLLESRFLKLAYFCMLNNAPDVGVDIALNFCKSFNGWQGLNTKKSKLYRALQVEILKYLGRWRAVPDETWKNVNQIFEGIFGFHLEGGSGFYPQLQELNDLLHEESA